MSVKSPNPFERFAQPDKTSPRLPAVPHRLIQYRKRQRWQSTDLLSADMTFDLSTAAAKRPANGLMPNLPPRSLPVQAAQSSSNERLRRHERTLLLGKKPQRVAARVRVEDKLKILTVSACPAEPRPVAGTRVRRGHVKGALTSFGVQASFDEV